MAFSRVFGTSSQPSFPDFPTTPDLSQVVFTASRSVIFSPIKQIFNLENYPGNNSSKISANNPLATGSVAISLQKK